MKKSLHASLLFIVLLFVGCGTKREYFEPKNVDGQVGYSKALPSPLKDVSRYGALLKNGQVITSDGLSEVFLEEGFTFVGEFDGRLISTNDSGTLHVKDKNGHILYRKKFSRTVVVASVFKDKLAVVDAGNSLYLVDMSKDEIYFTNKQDSVYALTAKVAAPYFLNFLTIFPTLDGKLVIVDWKDGKFVRDVVISSEPFFNNVFFLDVIGDRLIASTSKRAISINPKKTEFIEENIKDIIVIDDRIFIMTGDGRVIVANSDLKTLHERKFLFAVFLGAVGDKTVYLIERNGHLIATNLTLDDVKIYELPDKIKELVFMSKDTIFIDELSIKLHAR